MRSLSASRYAALLGLGAAIGYALQHPLSKPFFDVYGHGLGAICLSMIASECLGIFVTMTLLTNAAYRRELASILTAPKAIPKLLLLTAFSTLGSLAYLYAISRHNTVHVATILNIFPLYYLILYALVHKRRPKPIEVITFVIIYAGIIIIDAQNPSIGNVENLISDFASISIVPVLYALSTIYQQKFFTDKNEWVYVTLSGVIDSPLIILLALSLLFATKNDPVVVETFSLVPWVLFLTGGLASSLFAKTMLQKGISKSAGSPAKVIVWTYATPAISGIIGTILNTTFIKSNTAFDDYTIAETVLLTVSLLTLYNLNDNKAPSS